MAFTAHYSDGKTAQRHAVEIYMWGEDVRFRARDRRIDEQWSGDKLCLLEEAYAGKPLRLTHGDHPDAVITVADPGFIEHLIATHPRLARKVIRGGTLQRVVLWSAIAVAVLAGLILGAPRLAVSLARYVPDGWSTELGETVVSQFVEGSDVCKEPEGVAALRRVAQQLLAGSDYQGELILRVVDDPMINAFAAPGGQVIVFRGLLDKAQSGHQVVGVLAHELAHIAENHPLEGLAQQLALRFVLAMIVGDLSGLSGAAAGLGGNLIVSNYSRSMEAEADEVAVFLLNRSGYDASGLTSFFELLGKEGLGDLPDLLSWLSSHPLHEARVTAIRASDRGGSAALTGADWEAVQDICAAHIDD